jgi:hypothetical protein
MENALCSAVLLCYVHCACRQLSLSEAIPLVNATVYALSGLCRASIRMPSQPDAQCYACALVRGGSPLKYTILAKRRTQCRDASLR